MLPNMPHSYSHIGTITTCTQPNQYPLHNRATPLLQKNATHSLSLSLSHISIYLSLVRPYDIKSTQTLPSWHAIFLVATTLAWTVFDSYCICYHGEKLIGYSLSSQLTATELINLKTMARMVLPPQLFARHKFHCQTLHDQAAGNGQIDDFQGSSELGELRGHRDTTFKWMVCS